MLVENLPAFIEGAVIAPLGMSYISHYHLTFNKDDNGRWSAGYMHYDSGRVMLAINNADSLEEVAIRLNGRLERYTRRNLQPPRTLNDMPKRATVESANLTEGPRMADENSTEQLTFGEKAVGLSFNPSDSSVVINIKKQCAAIIDGLNAERNGTADPDIKRMYSVAITEIQTAQMWGVKAATWTPAEASNETASS